MLENMLSSRNLPDIWNQSVEWSDRRIEILDLLCREEYGFVPCAPDHLSWQIEQEGDDRFCAGKVDFKKILLKADFGEKSFSFPIYTTIPKTEKKHPFFIHINFRDSVPDKYMPTEEICDNGFAVLSFCYEDVACDNDDFSNGLASVLPDSGCGKIAMWAWAASRVMDYAQTLSSLDLENAAVVGHSRLGKTALLAGALDERFSYVISNNSGCSGAAISREKQGETIRDICTRFPFWFCEGYKKYMDNEASLPFDQHFLLAACAPRKVYVASAGDDLWADPNSEFLSCFAAGKVYEKLGLKGFVSPDRLPIVSDAFHDGSIGFHLRAGKHYLSREDWQNFMKFIASFRDSPSC